MRRVDGFSARVVRIGNLAVRKRLPQVCLHKVDAEMLVSRNEIIFLVWTKRTIHTPRVDTTTI